MKVAATPFRFGGREFHCSFIYLFPGRVHLARDRTRPFFLSLHPPFPGFRWISLHSGVERCFSLPADPASEPTSILSPLSQAPSQVFDRPQQPWYNCDVQQQRKPCTTIAHPAIPLAHAEGHSRSRSAQESLVHQGWFFVQRRKQRNCENRFLR
jgi:hypothetical protein